MRGKHIFSDKEPFHKLLLILLFWERKRRRKQRRTENVFKQEMSPKESILREWWIFHNSQYPPNLHIQPLQSTWSQPSHSLYHHPAVFPLVISAVSSIALSMAPATSAGYWCILPSAKPFLGTHSWVWELWDHALMLNKGTGLEHSWQNMS